MYKRYLEQEKRRQYDGIATCIGCGCDDLCTCATGCTWRRIDREAGIGICSNCGHLVAAWDECGTAAKKVA